MLEVNIIIVFIYTYSTCMSIEQAIFFTHAKILAKRAKMLVRQAKKLAKRAKMLARKASSYLYELSFLT